MPVPASAYFTVTVSVLAGSRATVKVRVAVPLSPSTTAGASMESTGSSFSMVPVAAAVERATGSAAVAARSASTD